MGRKSGGMKSNFSWVCEFFHPVVGDVHYHEARLPTPVAACCKLVN